MAALSSRGRMLTALNLQEPDRVPVTFWGQVAPCLTCGATPLSVCCACASWGWMIA